ncbi:carbohydrate ABC transporter permease [Thiospirochaeta perfilievii]|uniref:sn-glycerol-3-phosphate transport system permease protein UgpE n=1 Tax=Thiospirochaeta perfilievii TaxID=252967 RepID=A0A5C1QAF8_9SPIO|nr:carbohydrate ABC transporter permease [Thiospirochaeta perfilievii]QEN04457.1 carbohydrate ABC transporter permease [Thiospirochaeta perfilievii]
MESKKNKIILSIVGVLLALLFLSPFYLVVVNSFKTMKGIFINTNALPFGEYFVLSNYPIAFERLDFLMAIKNSLTITIVSTVFIVLFSSMAAWVLVRTKTWYSNFIFMLFAAAMLIPFQSVMLPLVSLMGKLNFLNPPGLIFMYVGFGSSLSIILYHGFIKSVPLELEEAAVIDGCNQFQIYSIVVFPLLKPITVTVTILNVMWIWNDFLLPQLTINKPEWATIPLKMFFFFGQYSKQWHFALAGLLITMLPVIIFYFFAQKQIVKGVMAGSIK